MNNWNKCSVCGQFIPFSDFENGKAQHYMVTPDSDLTSEEWESLCKEHNKPVETGQPV